MGTVKEIANEGQLLAELQNASSLLVVVDYHSPRCDPCLRMNPVFQQMAAKYPNARFLKADVDKCGEMAISQGVSSLPMFVFYRNRTKIDRVQGADPISLEKKIQQYIGGGDEDTESVSGHMDLSPFIMKAQCECLNESDDHPLAHALQSGGGFLQSDCDEQLIISVTFNQAVKIHSLKIKGPADKGPKTIKIFINQPRTLDFDMAHSYTSVQDVEVAPDDLDGNPINLRYVKFQNVQNVQFFIKDNQSGGEITQIDHLAIIGSPISTTNMGEFKRVAGKKGESH